MITVYFESMSARTAQAVATFEDESLYMACLPALESEAKKAGMFISESIDD